RVRSGWFGRLRGAAGGGGVSGFRETSESRGSGRVPGTGGLRMPGRFRGTSGVGGSGRVRGTGGLRGAGDLGEDGAPAVRSAGSAGSRVRVSRGVRRAVAGVVVLLALGVAGFPDLVGGGWEGGGA